VPATTPAGADPKRVRPRWLPSLRLLSGIFVLAGIVVFSLKAHSVAHEFSTVLGHFNVHRLPWLAAAIGAEVLSFWCYALVQRNLLLAGGARLPRRTMLRLAVAATGLTNLVPGGTAPASGWLVGQYRRRGISMPLALWAVLAGGFAATISVLLLVLIGASIAGLIGLIWTLACLVALVGGSVGVVASLHHLDAVDRWFRQHHFGRLDRALKKISNRAADIASFRTEVLGGTRVLALSIANWSLDVVCLVCAFLLLDLPVPWRAVIFAYAVAQIAGSLAPVPGGIGFVEGGMVGAFALAGTGVGAAFLATIVYRIITSWGVAAVGSITLLSLSRNQNPPSAELDVHGHSPGGVGPDQAEPD
jgi:putative heme transporter